MLKRPSVVVAVVLVLASCGAGPDDETTVLVSRGQGADLDCALAHISLTQPIECSSEAGATSYRDGSGTEAYATRLASTWRVIGVEEVEVGCGDRVFVRPTFAMTGESIGAIRPATLSYGGRGSVELLPRSLVFVSGLASSDDACSQVVGTWRGIDGEFEGRSGDFQRIEDTLQIELRIDGLT